MNGVGSHRMLLKLTMTAEFWSCFEMLVLSPPAPAC